MLIYNFGDWTQWLEPQKVTFLPEQRLIKIHPGETQIDVQVDLYSAWKEWIRYYDNAKWLPAFTTFGGDPTGESQFAPRYFFLTNGWKVYVENMSVVVQMNLYSDDGLSPFIVNNAAITNRASDVPIIRSEVERRLDYGDRIYYDETSPYVGTEYPNGTIAQPVNNIPDAIALANLYNITTFYILSNVNIFDTGNVFENYSIIADRENLTITIVEGNYLNNMDWYGFIIDANFGGGINKFEDCTIINALDTSGQMKACQINGTVRVWNTLVTSMCYSGIAGAATPIWDMHEFRSTTLSIRSYSGGVDLRWCNFTGDTTTVELIAGQIKLHETCTAGYIDLRGVGYITDNSSGATIRTTGFIDSFENYIEQTRATDERLAYGDRIYYDETSIFTGQTYPVGTIVQPVNNPIDAFQMSYILNSKKFFCLSDITLLGLTGYTISDYAAIAQKENLKAEIYDNYVNNFLFDNFYISANFSGGTNTLINSTIIDLEGFKGTITNSKLIGRIDLIDHVDIINCFSGDDLNTEIKEIPSVYLSSDSGVTLDLRNYSGDISINKMIHPDDRITIDVNSGKIIITSGVTAGIIDLRGVGYIDNNAGTGCTVKTDGFVNSFGTYIEESKLIDEQLAYGGRIYVDQNSGTTGTTYPSGTIIQPVKDPFYLSDKLGIKDFWVVSDYTYAPTEYKKDIILTAAHPNINLTIQNGEYIDLSKFVGFYILEAEFTGNFNTYDKCIIFNTSNFHGHIYDSEIWGELSIKNHVDLWRCWADHYANITSTEEGVEFGVVNWSGDLILKNSNLNDEFLINITSGKVTLESGCTNGLIDLRGVGYFIDNSSGATVITSGFISQSLTSEDVAKLTGITSSIDNMTISVDSLDEKVSYISGATYEMNQNVIIMTSGFTQIEDSMHDITNSIINMTNDMISLDEQVKRILGLSQENFRITNYTYSASNNLDSASVSIYNNSVDLQNGTNPIATYSMIALYDSSGRLVDYKVIKN